MSIRSTILALAVGCFAAGCVAEDSAAEETTGTVTEALLSSWSCQNVPSGLFCEGGTFPVITIDVKDIRPLNDNELENVEEGLAADNILNRLTSIPLSLIGVVLGVGPLVGKLLLNLGLIGHTESISDLVDDDITVCALVPGGQYCN